VFSFYVKCLPSSHLNIQEDFWNRLTAHSWCQHETEGHVQRSGHTLSLKKYNLVFNTQITQKCSKICDIQHLRNQRIARYCNFLDTRILYLMFIFGYLAASLADLTIWFVTSRTILFSTPQFLFTYHFHLPYLVYKQYSKQ